MSFERRANNRDSTATSVQCTKDVTEMHPGIWDWTSERHTWRYEESCPNWEAYVLTKSSSESSIRIRTLLLQVIVVKYDNNVEIYPSSVEIQIRDRDWRDSTRFDDPSWLRDHSTTQSCSEAVITKVKWVIVRSWVLQYEHPSREEKYLHYPADDRWTRTDVWMSKMRQEWVTARSVDDTLKRRWYPQTKRSDRSSRHFKTVRTSWLPTPTTSPR